MEVMMKLLQIQIKLNLYELTRKNSQVQSIKYTIKQVN